MPKSSSFGGAVGRHEDVGRLDVPVHHQVLVGVLHGPADVEEEAQALPDAEAFLGAQYRERPALDVLHDEVRAAVRRGAAVEKAGDVGMLQVREDLSLGPNLRSTESRSMPARTSLMATFFRNASSARRPR